MTGNGRASMRPPSRTPSFIIVAFIVVLSFIAYKYWSLHSQHGELTRQYDIIQIDLRDVTDKHNTAEKRAADLASKLADVQGRQSDLENSLSEKEKRVSELSDKVNSLKEDIKTSSDVMTKCSQDLEKCQQQEGQWKGEIEQLKNQLKESLEKPPPVCDKNSCKEPLNQLVQELFKVLNKETVMGALKTIGMDSLVESNKPVDGQQQNPADNQNQAGREQQPNQVTVPQGGQQQQEKQVAEQPKEAHSLEQITVGILSPLQPQDKPSQGMGGGGGIGVGDGNNLVFQENKQLSNNDHNSNNLNGINSRHNTVNNAAPQNGQINVNSRENPVNVMNVPAQEDLENDHNLVLPLDDMDRQAEANQNAQQQDGADGIDNTGKEVHKPEDADANFDDNHLHGHFLDLSKNNKDGGLEEDDLARERKNDDKDWPNTDRRVIEKGSKEDYGDYGPDERQAIEEGKQ